MQQNFGLIHLIIDMCTLPPRFIIGMILLMIFLFWLLREEERGLKLKISIATLLFFYLLSLIFFNVVGTPTLSELLRVTSFGEKIYNPNINYIPLVNGISFEFILNIFCFIPVGFLFSVIIGTFANLKNVLLFGLSLSFIIETSQLFTLYRATDINDLIANTFGVVIGWLCFKGMAKTKMFKFHEQIAITWTIPLVVAITAFLNTFL